MAKKTTAGPRRDYVGYGRQIPRVQWPGGARIAVSLVLNYEEGSEISYAAGDGASETGMGELAWAFEPGVRDFAIESVYEYGSRAGVWRLARLFDELSVPVTVYACAQALELNKDVADWIREANHEACCHGWRWEQVWRLTRAQEKEHIQAAIASLERTTGSRPRGWASRYCPSLHTRELLGEIGGFTYDSDAFNDDLPYFVKVKGAPLLVIPYSLTYNDARFVIPVGHPDPDSFLKTLKRGFDYLWEEGRSHPRMMSVGLHARMVGQAARASALKEFIRYAQDKGDVWFARRIDIADWWISHSHKFAA